MAIEVKYQYTMDAGRRGAIYDMQHRVLVSRTNMDEEAIGFGVAVYRHPDQDRGCTADGSIGTGDVFGVTVIDRSAYADRDLTAEGFLPTDECRIMRKGTVWLPAAVAVEAGDTAYAVRADGTFSNTGTATDAIGVWDTNAAEGALGVVRMDL